MNPFDHGVPDAFVAQEDTTNGGNAIGVIGTAVPPSENPNSNLQEQLDIQPFQTLEDGHEAGWASWLLCDDLNLDALNSSLLQVTTGEGTNSSEPGPTQQMGIDSPPAVSQPRNEKVHHSGGFIRRKWHTYCEAVSSDRVGLDPALENGRINECYREELAERLKPRVQTGTLPSTTFIVCYASTFFLSYRSDNWVATVSARIFQTFSTYLSYRTRTDLLSLQAQCSSSPIYLLSWKPVSRLSSSNGPWN